MNDIAISATSHTFRGVSITTILSYKDTAIKNLITALKYEQSDRAATICATLLADYLHEVCADLRQLSPRTILIIPIPPHSKRTRERGIDHTRRICEHLPHSMRYGPVATVRTDILIRTRYTPPQARLHRTERLKNIRGAFAVTQSHDLADTHVLLIDDVTTTGATLVEAAKVLRRTGARVSPIAIARA